MSTIIENIERSQMRTGIPAFQAGDRVRVHFQVVEGNRRRTQVFEGVVIRRQGSGVRETFTVRKQSFGVGVERTFPLHSPKIEDLEIASRGDVRRAKLYYLRGRVGKAARIAERRWAADDAASITDSVAGDADESPQNEGAVAAAEATSDGSDGAQVEETQASEESSESEAQDTESGESEAGAAAEDEAGSEGSGAEDAPDESSEADQRAH